MDNLYACILLLIIIIIILIIIIIIIIIKYGFVCHFNISLIYNYNY